MARPARDLGLGGRARRGPALAEHPERATILAGAAEAARLVGDFDAAERRADEAIAAADPDTQPAALSRAWSVRAVVAHFRGDFATARDAWLRAAEGATAEASAFVGSAALAAAYGGDPATARELLDRARVDRHLRLAPRLRRVRRGRAARDDPPRGLDPVLRRGDRGGLPGRLQLRGGRRAGVARLRPEPASVTCRARPRASAT